MVLVSNAAALPTELYVNGCCWEIKICATRVCALDERAARARVSNDRAVVMALCAVVLSCLSRGGGEVGGGVRRRSITHEKRERERQTESETSARDDDDDDNST